MRMCLEAFRSMIAVGWKKAEMVVIAGWIVFVLMGQGVLSVEVRALEWVAVVWLWVGMMIVRPKMCLPLLILSCPAFMCANHRAWAWAQPIAAWIFLVRILIEAGFTRRQIIAMATVGGIVFTASWPQDAKQLFDGIAKYDRSKLFGYWLGPEAVWSIFPFRQALDRSMMATLACGIFMKKRYFSEDRIWLSFWMLGIVALLAAYCQAFFPWQAPHKFLGTSNHATYGGGAVQSATMLFHGAGFNLSYFSCIIALSLPCFFAPASCRRYLRIATAGLLLPAAAVNQRTFTLAVFCFLSMAVVVFFGQLIRSIILRKPICANRLQGRTLWVFVFLLISSVTIASLWYLKMGVIDHESTLNKHFRARLSGIFRFEDRDIEFHRNIQKANELSSGAVDDVVPTAPVDVVAVSEPLKKRAKKFLLSRDTVRGHMWILGLRTCRYEHMFIGRGAGTWARFHRDQPRPYGPYYAHMHNTYIDLMFEYGLVPVFLLFVVCAIAVLKILFFRSVGRHWLFCLAMIAVLALGQHLFYAFTSMVLLLPVLVIILRALVASIRKNPSEEAS